MNIGYKECRGKNNSLIFMAKNPPDHITESSFRKRKVGLEFHKDGSVQFSQQKILSTVTNLKAIPLLNILFFSSNFPPSQPPNPHLLTADL